MTALSVLDRFAAAAIVRRTSPLQKRKALEEAGEKQSDILSQAKSACNVLLTPVTANKQPTARVVLGYVAETRLFTITDVLVRFAVADKIVPNGDSVEVVYNEVGEDEEAALKSELGV